MGGGTMDRFHPDMLWLINGTVAETGRPMYVGLSISCNVV